MIPNEAIESGLLSPKYNELIKSENKINVNAFIIYVDRIFLKNIPAYLQNLPHSEILLCP